MSAIIPTSVKLPGLYSFMQPITGFMRMRCMTAANKTAEPDFDQCLITVNIPPSEKIVVPQASAIGGSHLDTSSDMWRTQTATITNIESLSGNPFIKSVQPHHMADSIDYSSLTMKSQKLNADPSVEWGIGLKFFLDPNNAKKFKNLRYAPDSHSLESLMNDDYGNE